MEKAKKYLNKRADLFLFEHINGYRLIDYLVDEGITLSSDGILYWENKPIAYLGEEIIPIKGQKKRLRKALEKILEVKAVAEADEVYNSGLELGEAVAEANENAYWLGRFWKLSEGESDSISETLRRLDELPELDPSVEYENRIHEKELRRAEITIKILNELPHVRIEKKKILGIIPRYHVKLKPGYGEFFHNHLGDYTRSEIYSVLLELEDRLTGKNKESIRVLRKEFEKREGISRKKKAGVLAIFLFGVAMAIGAYYLYKKWSEEATITPTTTTPITPHVERPEIYSVKLPKNLSTNSYLPITVQADADKVLAEISINGVSENVTLTKKNGIFEIEIPVKEGIYIINKIHAIKDKVSISKDINTVLTAFDRPVINNVVYESRTKPGSEVVILVNASDTSGIDRAVMRVKDPSGKVFKLLGNLECGLYVFRIPIEKEPAYNFKLILSDPFNNTVTYNGSIISLDSPIINSIKINEYPDSNLAEILINATDTSGIKDVFAEYNSTIVPAEKVEGLYKISLPINFSKVSEHIIKIYAKDPFNQTTEKLISIPIKDSDSDGLTDILERKIYGTDPFKADTDDDGFNDKFEVDNGLNPLKPNPNVHYLYFSGLSFDNAKAIGLPLDQDGNMQPTEQEFDRTVIENKNLLVIPTLLNYYKNVASDGSINETELNKTINFSDLVNRLYEIIGENIISNLIPITDYATTLGLQLNFDEVNATNATAKAIGYYAIAVKDEELPEELRSLKILTAGTQIEKYGDKLVDFSPIIFYSVDGNDYMLEIDKPRNTWMLAKQMYLINQTGFPIIKHPEVFEGLNGKVIANAYSLFDAKYGISYMEKEVNNRIITPTDKDVWDLIMLQWKLYSDKAFNKSALYNRDFPWYNSTQLDNLYQDKNTRRQALLFLFYLPNTTWDLENQTKVFGIEGAKVSLIQADKEYQKISELYPDGKLYNKFLGNVDLRLYYYDWVGDRGAHELSNTVKQYVGLDWKALAKIIRDHPLDYWNYLKDYDGIDQYLTKNWSYWDLVKAIASYERWNPNVHEVEECNYVIPDILRLAGFPTSHINIEPTPKGAANREWAISLPDYILKNIQQNDILVGPGNTFGLYACKEGLEKDNIKEAYVLLPSTDKVIYLMKKY